MSEHATTDALARLEDDDVDTSLMQRGSRRHAGGAAAEHDDIDAEAQLLQTQ